MKTNKKEEKFEKSTIYIHLANIFSAKNMKGLTEEKKNLQKIIHEISQKRIITFKIIITFGNLIFWQNKEHSNDQKNKIRMLEIGNFGSLKANVASFQFILRSFHDYIYILGFCL